MGMLTDMERTKVHERLQALNQPVRLVFFGQSIDCDTCGEARRLLAELAEASAMVAVEELNLVLDREAAQHYGIDRAPGIAVAGPGDARVRFLGAPLGHEFGSLVDAVVTVSTGHPDLSEDTRARIATLARPVHIQVFSTPTCTYCARAVDLACRLAVESPLVTATAISAVEFPDLVRRHRVTGVPKIVMNDRVELLGAQPESVFVDAILAAAADA